MSPFVRPYDIPHLGLSLGIVAFCGQFIIRMDLNGEVAFRVNEFDQERELVARIGIDFFAYELAFELLHQFGDGLALEFSVGNDGFMALYAGKFPAFADIMLICNDFLIWSDFLAAPYHSLQYWFEF